MSERSPATMNRLQRTSSNSALACSSDACTRAPGPLRRLPGKNSSTWRPATVLKWYSLLVSEAVVNQGTGSPGGRGRNGFVVMGRAAADRARIPGGRAAPSVGARHQPGVGFVQVGEH